VSAIRVEGIAEFTELCARVGDAVGPRALRPIILRGAERFRDAVKASAAPASDTGATVETVEAHLVRREDIAAGYATVDAKRAVELRNRARKSRGRSPVDNSARYPFIVAAGAPAHLITARNHQYLLLGGARGSHPVKAVHHPGFTGSDFFARGVRSVRGAVKSQLETEVRHEIVTLARRYNVEVR